ncbi:MAG: hypothetical protein ACR2PG_10770 [Hyphomicrobiaceae bacterium]
MNIKSIVGLAVALATISFVAVSNANAAGPSVAALAQTETAASNSIVQVGRRGGHRRWRGKWYFRKFGHGFGCGHYYRKWKRTGRPFWKHKFFVCRHHHYY